MANKKRQSGKRFQILILQLFRDKEGGIKELYTLKEELEKYGERYKLLGASYGSPKNSLIKTCELYLDNNFLEHPIQTLFEINKLFIDKKAVRSLDVTDMGIQADFEKLGNIILKFFKKNEEKEKTEE
jgi:hypothetical protein